MKNIIITGASKGIGYETAKKLSESGNRVFAVARSGDKLQELANTAPGQQIVPVQADLSVNSDIKDLAAKVSEYGQVDVLINNAGVLINKPFMETSLDDWQLHLEINLLSPVNLIKELKPIMNSGSHIINISSMGGFQGSSKFPGLSAYSASKGALSILTESLSAEFSEDDIAVNCLCLGAVQTEMLEIAFPGFKAPVSPVEMAAYISEFALTGHKYYNGRILPVALNNPG